MLLNYGTDKLFLEQFYKPDANILFTPLGFLDSDILFWSKYSFFWTLKCCMYFYEYCYHQY